MLIADYGLTYPQRLNGRGFMEFSGDLRVLVRSSIYQILGTWIGERVMLPEFGSRIKELLFDPIDEVSIALARVYTIEAIEKWEPRVQLIDVTTRILADENILEIYGVYNLTNRDVQDSFQVGIPRLAKGGA